MELGEAALLFLWHRPWAQYGVSDDAERLGPGTSSVIAGQVWLRVPSDGPSQFNGRSADAKALIELPHGRLVALPVPLHASKGLTIPVPGGTARIACPGIPDRPNERNRGDLALGAAFLLLDRVIAVWARMRDVDSARADPAEIWIELHRRWMGGAQLEEPRMDIIVRQAREMPDPLQRLGRAPRRILRRTQQMIPLSRVQEVDRRALMWLVRQPGETMAERAGGRQRVRAVAREENLDTLENRVLHSYTYLAAAVSRTYAQRHGAARGSGRVRVVTGFQKQCRQLALDLSSQAVGEARADVTPNFVLQSNPDYRRVWDAWQELLRRERLLDDLWRWQAQSWEEFCALAVVVALQSIPGASVIATSPLVFRAEQRQGSWIEHVNPLAVVYLPEQGATVEVSYRHPGGSLAGFGSIIWLRFGHVDISDILTRWAVWPIWNAGGGLDRSDLAAIPGLLLRHGRQDKVLGGITIRPSAEPGVEWQQSDAAACMTLGAGGDALRDGLHRLRTVLASVLARQTP